MLLSAAIIICLAWMQQIDALDPQVSECCRILEQQFPDETIFFGASSSSYYSKSQAAMTPACRVYAHSASDVSAMVRIASQNQCYFAVRSGGHMFWDGSSNIGPDGIVIDLGKMKKIETKGDSVVSVEPGLIMSELYGWLDPLNLTVMGARVADVAIGGFLLGGGISFFTSTAGFASNYILNYEVVLADGSIINVNASSNSYPDLNWALKLGSTNYGIITRFDLRSYESLPGTLCGDTHFYAIGQLQDVAKILVNFTKQPPQTPSLFVAGVGWDPEHKVYSIFHSYSHNCQPGSDNLFSWIRTQYAPLSNGEFADEGPRSGFADMSITIRNILFPGGVRQNWKTVTFRNADATLIVDVFQMMEKTYKPLHDVGIRDISVMQPFTSRQLISGRGEVGYPTSLSDEDDGLIILLLVVEWDNAAHDDLVKEVGRGVWKDIENLARERDMLHSWIYLNYADSYQDVFPRSVTREDLARMVEIRKRYDPKDIFAKYWRGGFKLPRTEAGYETDPVWRDEL